MKRYIRSATYNGFDESEFGHYHLNLIKYGLENGFDISWYADPEFNSGQALEIYYGLKEGLDVSWYADPKFNNGQMANIRAGLEKGVDVSRYADPRFDALQMICIRNGLEDGVDISQYADPSIPYEEMKTIYNKLLNKPEKPKQPTDWRSITEQLRIDAENGDDPLCDETYAAQYLRRVIERVENKQGVWLEPSVRNGYGSILIHSNEDDSILAEADYRDYNEYVLDLALNSKNAGEFKNAYDSYLKSLI